MIDAIDVEQIAAIVLAAGGSSRLGEPKQLVRFRGETLVGRIARVALKAGFSPVVVVVSPSFENAEPLTEIDCHIVVNPNSSAGAASSINAGLDFLMHTTPQISATAILLCDQPFVTPEDLARLKSSFQSDGKAIAVSEYDGNCGVPAIFSREVFGKLLKLTGDAGARFLIRKMPNELVAVQMPSAAFDIDTPADLERLRDLETSAL
jgi:molybdenum cofactor cytidylyltransferase